jgi:uncharacterized protein (DUF697 family)
MSNNRLESAVTIHAFAVLHAGIAAALANTVVGDAPVLTITTIVMILRLAKLHDISLESGAATALAGVLFGSAAGGYLAAKLVSWIPIFGNALNAGVTFSLTEVIGWMAVNIFESGITDYSNISEETLEKLKTKAEQDRKSMDINSKIKELPIEAQEKYHDLESRLKDKNLNEEEGAKITNEMIELLKKYTNLT